MDTIYLDYASTAPRDADIVRARQEFELSHYANVGRGLYALSEDAEEWYQNSKKTVAEWVGCEPIEVLYTYSATYWINLITLALEHNEIIGKWDTILLSQSEHHANIVPWQILAERVGASIKFIQLDKDFRIDMDHLKSLLDESVVVVSLQYASNVTGAIHSLEEVRNIIWKERLFFIDAAQIMIHGWINMRWLGADGMVFSWHKMMADTGIGVLVLWRVLQKAWKCPISGGGAVNFVSEITHEQAGIPEKWQPGTPHITGAVSLKLAIDLLSKRDENQHQEYRNLIRYTNAHFQALVDGGNIQLFHSNTPHALGIWSFIVPNKHINDVAESLDKYGICVRSGHHCCDPLHHSWWVSGTVRVSIGHSTTQKEIDYFFEKLGELL